MEKKEINVKEMEEVVGGKGGYKKPPEPVMGLEIYQIQRGDTLTRIARRYNTTWMELKDLNRDVIKRAGDITWGYYIYVPARNP